MSRRLELSALPRICAEVVPLRTENPQQQSGRWASNSMHIAMVVTTTTAIATQPVETVRDVFSSAPPSSTSRWRADPVSRAQSAPG